jgi:hypothetical protein
MVLETNATNEIGQSPYSQGCLSPTGESNKEKFQNVEMKPKKKGWAVGEGAALLLGCGERTKEGFLEQGECFWLRFHLWL